MSDHTPWENLEQWPELQQRWLALRSSGRRPPAVLLEGSDELDPSALAEALVATEFCTVGTGCGNCSDCLHLTQCTDVWRFIEPDKYIRIDVVARLQEHLQVMSPRQCRAVILPKAERLTNEAVSRLLKTIEEPPEHSLIILTTSHPRLLPKTILGRCCRLRLKRISTRASSVSEPAEQVLERLLLETDGTRFNGEAQAWAKAGHSLNELLDGAERALNSIYRQILGVDSSAENSPDKNDTSGGPIAMPLALATSLRHPKGVWERREFLRRARRLGIRGQVTLNSQLTLEGIKYTGVT